MHILSSFPTKVPWGGVKEKTPFFKKDAEIYTLVLKLIIPQAECQTFFNLDQIQNNSKKIINP